MQETVEFRIKKKYAHLLLKPNEGSDLGSLIVIETPTSGPRFEIIKQMNEFIKSEYNDYLFLYSVIKRKYDKEELENSPILHVKITKTFEPAGEECGTIYNNDLACNICGANGKQVGQLMLKESSIPHKDISRTIAGEVVVSERFAEIFKNNSFKGVELIPLSFKNERSNYYQLIPSKEVELSQKTIAGSDIFDLSSFSEGEIYKCPKGHTIGLNLLSEPYINSKSINHDLDIFSSKQMVGVRRGLLRPKPLYFCTQNFRQIVLREKLKGFAFEMAHIL